MDEFKKVLTLSEDPNTPGLPRFADQVNIFISPEGVVIQLQEKFAKKNGKILNGDSMVVGNISRPGFPNSEVTLEGDEKAAADKRAAAFIAKIAPIIQDFVNS